MDTFAAVVSLVFGLLTAAGIAYSLIALWGARGFSRSLRLRKPDTSFQPGVSILKPLKGVDPHLYAGLMSHCEQRYGGAFELVFGVSDLNDPAVGEVARLRIEYPDVPVQLIHCPERLGPNGKASNLAQMLPHAAYEHIVVNDADILVSPLYLSRVVAPFAAPVAGREVGMVTAPYIGRAESTIPAKLEALGISTDFMPGMFTARQLEGGLHFGLGSTLATTKSALARIGGFEGLTDVLSDDYEMGARLHKAGYAVELIGEVVETTVPAYRWEGFFDHQLRWSRAVRDSRRLGYLGLGVTYTLPWAVATVIASGVSLWSLSLFSVALLARITVALTVGVGLLRDGQVLSDIWLIPVRDCFGLFFWAWSYASDEVVWRGERFRLKRGVLTKLG